MSTRFTQLCSWIRRRLDWDENDFEVIENALARLVHVVPVEAL